jgi:hypothetical protein
MLVAKIIHPNKCRLKTVKCSECGLSYKKDDYLALFEGFKLKFFKIKDIEGGRIVCHDCLFENLNKISFGESVKFAILSEENEYLIEFHPEEYYDGFIGSDGKSTYSDGDSMEDFLEDLE